MQNPSMPRETVSISKDNMNLIISDLIGIRDELKKSKLRGVSVLDHSLHQLIEMMPESERIKFKKHMSKAGH
jgi:hypothetical protein